MPGYFRPGATNLVTGIATAFMDSIPMVAITCNVGVSLHWPRQLSGDRHHRSDHADHQIQFHRKRYQKAGRYRAPGIYHRAERQTGSGPDRYHQGCDCQQNRVYKERAKKLPQPDCSAFNEDDLKKAIQMIEKAKKPYIFVGGGAILSGASEVLKTFVEKKQMHQVCDTLMGKGAYDGTSENYTGMLGMHGTKASNLGVSHCDLLIAVGTRFSDRVLGNPKTFAKNAKILQIDVDPVEINKNICVSASIIGDVKAVLTVINRRLEAQEHKEWLDTVKEYKEKYPLTYDKGRLTCPEIMEAIYDITKGEAVITTEVGQHQIGAAQFYKYDKPRKFLTSGGLGTMGYGLGASLGAKVGNPDKDRSKHLQGDGCSV